MNARRRPYRPESSCRSKGRRRRARRCREVGEEVQDSLWSVQPPLTPRCLRAVVADPYKPTEIRSWEDLFGPGAEPGTVPTDLEQSTGLERLEILGKMEGVDIFDMSPLDASRKGELPSALHPIVVCVR